MMSRGHLSFDPPAENVGRTTPVAYALVILNVLAAALGAVTALHPGLLAPPG
jgi:hypothetical protein